MKRFYKQAEAVPLDPDGYGVALDGRRVRTPAGRPLALPSRALAAAVADEWAGQGERVEPRTMAMMTLSATALDRVAPRAGEVADEIARYGETDLLCYRDAAGGELAQRQNAAWQPVLDWLAATHGAKLTTVAGVMPASQETGALEALRRAVDAHEPFRLTALHTAVAATGSAALGMALLGGRLDACQAWRCARLDDEWQAERWGEEEDARKRGAALRDELAAVERFAALL
ncbi:MAG: ATPase [Alphaproteobacteria bacterium]|nr:ATPase [Alphaproteobacteria bacterium]